MKRINLSLLIIWLALIVLGCWWAWQDFNNMQTIAGGGYLYNDNGEVVGLWDKWEKANYPDWMFGIVMPIILLTGMPVWWMVSFWGIGFYLGFLFLFVYRPCISLR